MRGGRHETAYSWRPLCRIGAKIMWLDTICAELFCGICRAASPVLIVVQRSCDNSLPRLRHICRLWRVLRAGSRNGRTRGVKRPCRAVCRFLRETITESDFADQMLLKDRSFRGNFGGNPTSIFCLQVKIRRFRRRILPSNPRSAGIFCRRW